MSKKIVIIGNGVAGITTAIELRKISDCEITVVSEESEYFFSRTALMYVFMGHMKFEHTQPFENSFWAKNNITLKKGRVNTVFPEKNEIAFENGGILSYDYLVLATGSKPNKYNWPGQDLDGVSGLYHKQDLEYLEKYSSKIKKAVVVGGGLIGLELAEMLNSRGIEVTFLVRENSFWSMVLSENEGRMLEKHILSHGIQLKLKTELKEIKGKGSVESVISSDGESIECQFVGLTVGVSPNVGFLQNSSLKINKGILVNEFLQTNIPNIYAIGDCAEIQQPQPGRRPIEAVWYTGKIMGQTLAKTLAGQKTAYIPGNWFNSAKFFDIEYQTYGLAPAKLNEYQGEYYWEKENKAVRIVFNKENRVFEGINTFGIRMRQDFFEKVLNRKESVDFVMKNLDKANFDPEFFRKYENEIKSNFNLQNA
ncbi:NAD(P)/FAD-dependent oxidoreductase [Lacihabitans soyangensis]|uniref:NAD(P)/FAD-dependent oxidoreductase n=1 Tax=Lacihabitans soyangensis TaxID=869394 RepID=A0AAE3H3Q2_9BACT|nr:FAD-dependent oxidoreductase [Lacihabitans soyangensis]MCP9764569.1 NAD(P)/FAD-dependent oxidoreductase [Lacihabitans soyangensis]